ncbi:hypothetical protein TNCV_1161001 [Trichonephila clavipes]|nr:hypothetical protein TNCV_1161001 [Trichonephila clavipes]
MTDTLPPLLDSVVGGGTPERSCVRVFMDPILLCPVKGLVLPTTLNIEPTVSTALTSHKSLNSCRGVISETELCTSDAEILEGFSDQGVVQFPHLQLKQISTFTNPIAAIISESEPVNAIPNNVPFTSNLSTVPSNSGVQSASIQDAKQKGKKSCLKK